MKIGVLGTGMVGRTLAGKLAEQGHDVMLGTRDPDRTRERTEQDRYGNPPFSTWLQEHPDIGLGAFDDAAAHGVLVINATAGEASLAALATAGAEHLAGKILLDVANPLDFSRGMPPSLTVANTDSLGERIQDSFPTARVVKALNTMNALVMVNPGQVGGGDHSVFLSGNDADAKAAVRALLEGFGWRDIIDLGDITTARGTEMLLPLWVRLFPVVQTPIYNFKIVR